MADAMLATSQENEGETSSYVENCYNFLLPSRFNVSVKFPISIVNFYLTFSCLASTFVRRGLLFAQDIQAISERALF